MTSLLIVDEDSAALTALTEAFLQAHKFRIHTAKTAGEALQKAKGSQFDLIVVSDRGTAEVAALLQAIRRSKLNRTAPAVAISSTPEQSAKEWKEKGLELVLPVTRPASPAAILEVAAHFPNSKQSSSHDLDTDFLNAVITSVAKGLVHSGRTQNVLPDEPFSPPKDQPVLADYSAVLALCFPEYQNLLAISFPKNTFENLTRLADEKRIPPTEFINGIAAETVQGIRAKFKESEPYAVNLIDTPKHTVAPPETSRSLVIPLDCDAGKILIQFFIKA